MCSLVAWSQSQSSNDQPSQAQNAAQGPAVSDHIYSNSTYLRNNLDQISNQVLLLWGSQDLIFPIGNADILLSGLPSATLLQYGDAGHAAILQHANDSAAIISSFLDTTSAA